MVFDDPQSRNEAILQNLLGADNVLVEPESRIEAILQSILNETAYLEEPQSRMEELLLAVKDDETGWDAEALSRNEAIIIAWLNDEEYTEEPQSRIEELLIAWLASIPKYVLKTVTGTTPITVTDAVNQHIVSLVQTGKVVQSGTPTPSAPVDIVCNNGVLKWDSVNQHIYADGTPEVLTVLANQNTDPTIIKATLASGTTEVRYNNSSSCIVASIKSNTTYAIGFITKPSGGSIFRVVTTKNKVSQSVSAVASIAYNLDMDSYNTKVINSGEDAEWMYVQLSNTMSAEAFASIIIQEGTSIHNPQTASVVNLFAVGDVSDEQNIISGHVTRKIGVKVFDGTETFSKSSAYGKAFLINAASSTWGADRTQAVLCTHFLGLPQTSGSQEDNTCFFNQTGHFYFRVTDNSDVNAFKAWLAEQYAAGTPVIVAYALSEESSETVTVQHLETANGSNTISVVSEVGQVDVAMTYRAKAGD